MEDMLTIGQIAERTGVATSALRFYEERGFINSERTSGNQRRYRRSVIRIVSIIKAGQAIGMKLSVIQQALDELPDGRVPSKNDWKRMSRAWSDELDMRIERLEELRDELADCIGCGCLSLRSCAIFNPGDVATVGGPGPRYLMGDERTSHRPWPGGRPTLRPSGP